MRKFLNVFFIVYWLGLFTALFFGYNPNKVEIGVAFLMSAMAFITID